MTAPLPPDDYEAQVLARFEGDRELLCEIAQLFLEDSPQILEAVRAAVAARDGEAVHRTAHTLKGSVSNFLAANGLGDGEDPARRTAAAALALEQLGAEERLQQLDGALATVEAALAQLRRRLEQLLAA